MRVLLAHNFYNYIGGAEVFYHEVGRVLEENGHAVAYFSPSDTEANTPWKPYFPDVVNYKNKNIVKSIFSIKNMIYSTNVKRKFEKLLKDFKPDIVHVFAIYIRLTPSILEACKENKIPVVMSCNEYKHICPNYKLYHHGHICEECKGGKFYNAMLNQCAQDSLMYSTASTLEAYVHNWMNIYRKNVDLFLFASEFMAKKTEEFWGKETFQWDMLKNPFESNQYELSEEYEDYILFFGRLIDEKGVDILISAMQYVPQCQLKIIGNGPDEEKLKKLTSHLKLKNIEFCGSKWGDELNVILKKTRFVVVPSLWYENFPYVILQSFALGKAVLGSSRGGIPELIMDGKHGYVYDATDAKDLSVKIALLWKSSENTVAMGKRAKNYVDINFNDKQFYENVMRVYKKVVL